MVMKWLLISMSGFLFGYTLVVATRYMLHWRVIRRQPQAALPLHIWIVAFSYNLLLLGVALQALVKVRWWHPFVYLPALGLGIGAMYVLGRAQRKPDPNVYPVTVDAHH